VLDLPPDISFRLTTLKRGRPPIVDTLSADERERLSAFGSARRRDAFILGRVTAREVLSERTGMRPEDIPLVIASDGACEIAGRALTLSIAHTATESETVAAAAVAGRAIGVDVEVLRPRRPDLYRRILSPDEYPLLEEIGHDHPQVVLWAVKEAVLKARRSGFRCPARDVRLQLDPHSDGGLATIAASDERWVLRYEVREEVVISIAYAA
jgi:phosphopantetheinyl transferase